VTRRAVASRLGPSRRRGGCPSRHPNRRARCIRWSCSVSFVCRGGRRSSIDGRHRPTPRAAMSLFSDPSMPPIPVTPPPRSCGRLGRQSCRTWRPQRLDHEPRRRYREAYRRRWRHSV